MPEPFQIIRNTWSVGKCSLQSCWARGIKKKTKKKQKKKKQQKTTNKQTQNNNKKKKKKKQKKKKKKKKKQKNKQTNKLVAALMKFHERHHDLVIPTSCGGFQILMFCQWRVISSHTLLHTFPSFRPTGLWAWWAKLAYQLMLTIRGRLITLFILGVHFCWSKHSDLSFVYGFMS